MRSRTTWFICPKCNRRTRSIDKKTGICNLCNRFGKARIPMLPANLKDAIDKIYTVRCVGSREYPTAVINVPTILIGRKIKLILVKE